MTDPEEGRAWRAQRGDQFLRFLLCQFWTPCKDSTQAATYESRRRNTGGYGGIYPHEGGARGLDPSGCQPSIREAVLGHRRDVTLRYGWIWGLGSWTLCLSPADWVQYAQGAMD